MTKRNLIENPCWSSKDLGQALPDSPHAVSVCLPRWEDVIAYEEKDPACIDVLKAIYPRFGLNRFVGEVAKKAIELIDFQLKKGQFFWSHWIKKKAITSAKNENLHHADLGFGTCSVVCYALLCL